MVRLDLRFSKPQPLKSIKIGYNKPKQWMSYFLMPLQILFLQIKTKAAVNSISVFTTHKAFPASLFPSGGCH